MAPGDYLLLPVTLDTDIAILVSNTYNFAGLVPPLWHLGGHIGRLGTLWWLSEQQEGHVGVQNHIFCDFGMILAPHFKSFVGSDGLKFR